MKPYLFLIFLICSIGVSACHDVDQGAPKFDSPSAPKPSDEGGISGGGGGTLPVEHADVRQIEEIVRGSKRDLRLFFRYMNDSGAYFSGPSNLMTVLESTDLEFRKDAPCFDGYRNPVDGSAVNDRPNTICISGFLIAPKVAKERAHVEVLALIAHELSHQLGADEAAAINVQKTTAYFLSDVNLKDWPKIIQDYRDRVSASQSRLDRVLAEMNSADAKTIYQDLALVPELYGELAGFQDVKISPVSSYQKDFYMVEDLRFSLAKRYAAIQASPSTAPGSYDGYNDAFKGKDELTYGEFFGGIKSPWSGEIIKKIHSRQELESQLQQLRIYVHDLENNAYALDFDLQMPIFLGQPSVKKPNPWLHFIGSYKINTTSCTSSGSGRDVLKSDIAISIFTRPGSPEEPVLREFSANGYGDKFELFDNGSTVDTSDRITVDGTQTSAVARVEAYTSWSKDWSRKILELSQTPDGYTLTITSEYQPDPIVDIRKPATLCKYQLTK